MSVHSLGSSSDKAVDGWFPKQAVTDNLVQPSVTSLAVLDTLLCWCRPNTETILSWLMITIQRVEHLNMHDFVFSAVFVMTLADGHATGVSSCVPVARYTFARRLLRRAHVCHCDEWAWSFCQIHARFTQKQGPWCQFGFIVIHNTRLKKNATVQPKTLLKYKVFGSNELLHVCTNTYGPPVFVLLSSTTTELSLCWIDINTAYPRQRAT